MTDVKFKYLTRKRDRHGKWRWWVRRGRRWRAIPVEAGGPDQEGFSGAYWAARNDLEGNGPAKVRQAKKAEPGGLRWLVQRYCASGEFLNGLGKTTQTKRRRLLERICDEESGQVGDTQARFFRKRHIKAIRDRHLTTPEGANSLVKALRYLFDWAIADEKLTANPANEVKLLKPGNARGLHRWTESEVQAYEKRHPIGTKAHLALSLFLYTGGRISDVARFGKQMVRDGMLAFVEFKGRERNPKDREIPVLAVLREAIDAAAAAGVTTGNLTFLVTEAGHPFSIKGLGNKMRQWCDEAELPQCSAHGLRKVGATRAADNGATAHQLMAIFGWQTLKEAERYTKESDRKRHVREAMHLIAGKGTTAGS